MLNAHLPFLVNDTMLLLNGLQIQNDTCFNFHSLKFYTDFLLNDLVSGLSVCLSSTTYLHFWIYQKHTAYGGRRRYTIFARAENKSELFL